MRLDEIAATWGAIDEALDASGGEVTPEIQAQLETISLAEKERVDHTVFYLKALQGEADALAKLGDEIYAKRQAKLAKKESLMRYVRWYMEQRQAEKLAGEVFRFQLCKSGKPPVEVLVPVDLLPEGWKTTEVRADREAIREWLAANPASSDIRSRFARIGEPTLSLRVF